MGCQIPLTLRYCPGLHCLDDGSGRPAAVREQDHSEELASGTKYTTDFSGRSLSFFQAGLPRSLEATINSTMMMRAQSRRLGWICPRQAGDPIHSCPSYTGLMFHEIIV